MSLSLMKFLHKFHWCIAFDPTFTAAKKNAKRGKTAVKHVSTKDAQADSFLWADATSSLVGSACDMYMHPLASGSTGRALSLAQL